MTLSDVLSIAMALAMTYAMISMIASTIKEAIAGGLQWRAKDLEHGIRQMVTDAHGAPLVSGSLDPSTLFAHPLIAGLSVSRHPVIGKLVAKLGSKIDTPRPSYVPARNFTLALVDVLCEGKSSPAMTAIETSISELPEGALKKRLKVFADEAGGDLDALKSQVDKWFDDTMDRLSGAYKRRSQVVLFIIGAFFAIVVNIDTIAIVRTLQASDQLRTNIAAQATSFAADHQAQTSADLKEMTAKLSNLGLPIGWETWPFALPNSIKSLWDAVIKLVGLALTAVAVSLGAPFWFDLLNQLVSVRSTGPKPARADEASSSVSSSS